MPGKIIQSMRKVKSSDPLFLLEGVDKMGADFLGDPCSALLEVLDPEQNHTFKDHYLDVDYDLSDVMFITTANTLKFPQPLMDCMEIIPIAGYTEDEKVEIARKHLIPHAIAKHGLKEEEWSINDEALLLLIRRYTREAGVRNLERELSSLIRKAVKELTLQKKQSITVEANTVPDYLGVPKFRSLHWKTVTFVAGRRAFFALRKYAPGAWRFGPRSYVIVAIAQITTDISPAPGPRLPR
jgi:ATP-dependent Lon protease